MKKQVANVAHARKVSSSSHPRGSRRRMSCRISPSKGGRYENMQRGRAQVRGGAGMTADVVGLYILESSQKLRTVLVSFSNV